MTAVGPSTFHDIIMTYFEYTHPSNRSYIRSSRDPECICYLYDSGRNISKWDQRVQMLPMTDQNWPFSILWSDWPPGGDVYYVKIASQYNMDINTDKSRVVKT